MVQILITEPSKQAEILTLSESTVGSRTSPEWENCKPRSLERRPEPLPATQVMGDGDLVPAQELLISKPIGIVINNMLLKRGIRHRL